MPLFIYGLSTGLLLQLAVGPVFFFVVGIAMRQTVTHGLFAVAGVTVVDYLYIALSLFGVGKVLERPRIRGAMRAVSGCVIIVFGVLMIISALYPSVTGAQPSERAYGRFTCFVAAFLLTLSSPLTILFWTGLFSAKAIEHDFNRRQLLVFGYSAGLSTVLFLGGTVITVSLIKQALPSGLLLFLNIPVGIVLIVNGMMRLFQKNSRRTAWLHSGGKQPDHDGTS